VCNIFHLHKAFSPPTVVAEVAEKCSTAAWGCIACKQVLFEHMEAELVPIRRRAAELRESTAAVTESLEAGAERCRGIARETMRDVKEMMGLT
jgi:tryptophanyl-tRNA synthetase